MAQSSLVGNTLDRYKLLDLIGTGGMGSVYLGEHVKIQKKVAVKVLHPHLADAQPQSVQRMLNEAKAAATIGHPGIVDVLDFGESDDGHHFLVMELLNGTPLDDLIEEKGKLKPDLALAVGNQVLSALGAAHKKGIIHRDLKPDNIFLHISMTGLYEIKLLDFGISKFTLDPDMKLTATGVVMGTPHYMSLEQTQGRTDIDSRTDLYSLGVILYKALSGELPFDGENVNQVIVAILKGQYKPLSAICPELDPGLAQAVQKAMTGDRNGRYATADDFMEAIKPFWDPQHESIEQTFRELKETCANKPPSGLGWKFGFLPSSPGLSKSQIQPAGGENQSAGPEAKVAVADAPPPPSPATGKARADHPPTVQLSKGRPRPDKGAAALAATQGAAAPAATRGAAGPAATRGAAALAATQAADGVPPPPAAGTSAPIASGAYAQLQYGDSTPPPKKPTLRERWRAMTALRKVVVVWLIALLIFAIVLPIIVTKGCGACEGEKPAATRKHRRKKKKKKKKKKKHKGSRTPRFIREIKNLF